MTEENTEVKKEIEVIPGTNPYLEDLSVKCIVTKIGFGVRPDKKYEVFVRVPQSEEQCKDFYDTSLAVFGEAGARQLSTRVNFKSIFNDDGTLPRNGHARLQKLMDEYQTGSHSSGGTVKAKADATTELMALWGYDTLDEMKAKIEKMKADQA